jgi:hypothetical protein
MASPIRDNPKLVSGISWRRISASSDRLHGIRSCALLNGADISDLRGTAAMGTNDLAGGCD